MSKLMVAGAFAAGYVLGAKAGRERYEEIRSAFVRFTSDPHVQEVVTKIEERAMNFYNDHPHSGNGVTATNRSEGT